MLETHVENGVFHAEMKGRVDTLNAPIILNAYAEALKDRSCEGLTQYLSADEFTQLIGGIREILIRHGGAWVTSDFGVDYEAFATANMVSPDAVKLYHEARRRGMRGPCVRRPPV